MRNLRARKIIAAITPAILTGCAAPVYEPTPEALAPWTTELRSQQPGDAYAAIYNLGERRIVFLGAKHATLTDSLTFRLIDEAYDHFDIDVLIKEGFPTARGPNAERLIRYAEEAEEENGFQPRGETVPAVLGALNEGAVILGGEPDDLEIKNNVLAQGFSETDLLGFYTLRSIPQWIRERRIHHAGDTRIGDLIAEELVRNRKRLSISSAVLETPAAWFEWYEQTNDKPLGEEFSTEEAGPLVDGPYGSNAVAAAISRARAEHLHKLIVSRANLGETVMIVFGASHFMIHRPAMAATFGPHCYIGADMTQAANACATQSPSSAF